MNQIKAQNAVAFFLNSWASVEVAAEKCVLSSKVPKSIGPSGYNRLPVEIKYLCILLHWISWKLGFRDIIDFALRNNKVCRIDFEF